MIIPYLKYEANLNKEIIDEDDIRYKYINDKINNNPINDFKLSIESKKYLNENFKYIFDYLNKEDFGLIRLTTNFEICNNQYQSLYNFIVSKSLIETNDFLNRSFTFKNIKNSYEEYINFTNNIDVYNYFHILENQTKILFYDFGNFSPNNKIYCKFHNAPSIEKIIEYIELNNYYSIPPPTFSKLSFNNVAHHLLITPYLIDNLKFLDQKDEYTNNIMNIMNKYINNLFDMKNINLRDINPDTFLINIYSLINLFNLNEVKLLYVKKYFIDLILKYL